MKANVPNTEKLGRYLNNKIAEEGLKHFERVKDRLHDIDLLIMLTVLRNMKWGKIRLQRFMDAFIDTAEEYGKEYDEAMYEALKLHLKLSGFDLTDNKGE